MAPSFAVRFARETWSLYGLGVLLVVLRFVARIRRLGITGLLIDDALMALAVVWYTVLCISLNKVASGGGSNLMTAEDIAAMTPADHDERVRGSIWVFVSEHAMIFTIWTLKACMLMLYGRITEGLDQFRLVIYAAVYTLLCFIGSEMALLFSCRPIALYFAVPTPNYQCSSYQHYEIAQGVLSITSDILILIVAMPILIAVRLPKRQKIILLVLFGMGLFIIVSALLTKIYCLVPSLISYKYMNWYFREATIAILVTNIPLMWSLIRDFLPGLKRWINYSTDSYEPQSWFKDTISGRRSRVPRDLALRTVEDTTTATSTSREHINPASSPLQTIDEEFEKTGKGTIHVQQDVILDVENARHGGRSYPVWDWNGNRDHASAADIAGGHIDATK